MDGTDSHEYTWQGREGPFTIVLTRDVFAPTRTSMEVAEGLRVNPGDTVIDVGSGSGVLSCVPAAGSTCRPGPSRTNEPSCGRPGASSARAGCASSGSGCSRFPRSSPK